MWLWLRSAGLFLGCWLLLSVLNIHVGVLVDGLLVSRYSLISHGGGTSCLYRSRTFSGADNSSNHKRELVSIMAKKMERREGSTDGNPGKNKGFAQTIEGPARKIIGEEKQVKEKDPPTNLRAKLGKGIQMREINGTINELLQAVQGPNSNTRVLVDSYTSNDGKFYEVFQDVQGEYIVGPVLRDPKWDVHPFNDPALLSHIYQGVKEEFLKDQVGEEKEKERNYVAKKWKGLGGGNEGMNSDDEDDKRFELII